MAKSDRRLTLDDILAGNISEEYLDKKERKAVIKRHLYRLSVERDFIVDKIDICGEEDELVAKRDNILEKMDKLSEELRRI